MASFPEPEISRLDMMTAEDPMELSSEIKPLNAEDIDIDLMANDLLQESDDDLMVEDLISVTDQELPDVEVPQAGNDDEMFDDEYPSGEFQESRSAQDEDLEDAEESTIGDSADIIIATAGESTVTQSVQSEAEVSLRRETDASYAQQDLQQSSVQYLRNSQEHTTHLESGVIENQANADPQVTSSHGNDWPGELQDGPIASSSGSDAANDAFDQKPDDVPGLLASHEDEQARSGSLPKSEDVTTNQDELLTSNINLLPHPPYVHPVVVVYQDNEMSLFPPIDQDQEHSQTYLLHDETHAAGSINYLLGACRTVLGDSISEQDELEVQIEDLGLHLSEFAPESSTTTLAEILDIYIQLHRYDGLDNPGPLYIALNTRFRFSQRMNYLINAVAEGRGFSQLPLLESANEDDRQSEDVEERDDVGGDDSHNSDGPKYVEEDRIRPVNDRDDDGEREEDKEDGNRKDTQNAQNNLKEPVHTTRAFDADHRSGSTPSEDDVQAAQLSGSRGERARFDEGGTKEEQSLVPKAGEEVGVSSSAAVDEHVLRDPMETGAEEEDFINYEEDEEDVEAEEAEDTNREFSTRSSTIQGDSIEASKDEFATTTDNIPDNDPAVFIDDRLHNEDRHRGSTAQEQTTDGLRGVVEADETNGRGPNESIGAGDDGLLDDDEEAEGLELEIDEHEHEHENERLDTSGPNLEDEPDNPDEGIDGEDPAADKPLTEPNLIHKSTKGYRGEAYQIEDIQSNEPPHDYNGAAAQTGLDEHDKSYDNPVHFTADHTDSGESTEALKTNGTLSNSNERNPDQDREPDQKLTEDIDEINYEDEELSSKIPAEHVLRSSPGSLKRTRSDREDDPQDLKRIRSG